MNLNPEQTIRELADLLGCSFVGDPDHVVKGINEIHRVREGDLVFVDHPKYYHKALNSEATTILIDKEVDCPEGKALLISKDPPSDFNKLNSHFRPFQPVDSNRGENVSVGSGSWVAPNVVFGNNISIGKDCVIHPGVVIYDNATIGDRVIIHANSVIGSEAFYYKKRDLTYEKMHTAGSVEIEDDVEIGASCTIDKGLTSRTRIGRGTKMDNAIHVGHDCEIGEDCLFAAQVGIAGCVTIEDNVTLWGQVGVVSGITIGKGAVVLGQSGLMRNVEGGKTYLGSPAKEARAMWRELAAIRVLPGIVENINE